MMPDLEEEFAVRQANLKTADILAGRFRVHNPMRLQRVDIAKEALERVLIKQRAGPARPEDCAHLARAASCDP